MNALWGHAVGVLIVLLMLVFGGILFWAWLPHHKKAFDTLARLPMGDGGVLDQTRADNQR